jgi:peptidoglycan/LPS O-acetylase OafA/YrhL
VSVLASPARAQADRASSRLAGLEALRGLAASAVVVFHAARHVDKVYGAPRLAAFFRPGHAGVDLFFVISGFIILFVHRNDIGRPGRLTHYLGRRVTRVIPLYWVALGLTVAMGIAGGQHGLDPARLAWSATLLPTQSAPLLGIAWTLQFEIVFYAAFAVLILDRRAGAAVLGLWLAAMTATALGFGAPGVPQPLCGTFGFEFFMGMAAAQLLHRGLVPAPVRIAALGACLFCLSMLADGQGWLVGETLPARFAYGLPAALLLAGLAGCERSGALAIPAWLRTLGGASYSIYLFQFVFIGAVWQAVHLSGLSFRGSSVAFALGLAGIAIAGGVVVSRLVERPLLNAMRRKKAALA